MSETCHGRGQEEMKAQLRKLGPNPKIRELKIPSDNVTKTWLAGRGTCCQIYTKSKYASRKHFCISYRENKFYISDLQSANGTFLNDEKITFERMLTFGNVISVGVPSNLQNMPDCVVFVFESCPNLSLKENSINSPNDDYDDDDDDDICVIDETVRSFDRKSVDDIKNFELKETALKEENKVQVDCSVTQNVKEPIKFSLEGDNLNKMILVKSLSGGLKRHRDLCDLTTDEKTVKITKLSEKSFQNSERSSKLNQGDRYICESDVVFLDNDDEIVKGGMNSDCNDNSEAYEAPTQVDKIKVESETSILNYSQTEELIEISDSEDEDWRNIELKETNDFCEGEDIDDDVVFIEKIIKCDNTISNVNLSHEICKIEDELTETDKRWVDKLIKIKNENDFFSELEKGENKQCVKVTEEEKKEKKIINKTLTRTEICRGSDILEKLPSNNISSCSVKLSEVSKNHQHQKLSQTTGVSALEEDQSVIAKSGSKKKVSFDLVPKIRYFETPDRVKLSALEKGSMRFAKIFYSICNWNTMWLEECKRVASEKDPPDICDEPLRKIPKKFTSHADYMSAFVPLMLLHVWNKVKNGWKNFGDTAFRQTISCDFYEGYHTDNLSVCKCTGLVRSVEAHKQLVRDGHLVMLRLHQSRDRRYTSVSEKYSKKLGYLVFGLLESKVYERFHGQSVHPALEERCASTHGDLHLVRLNILVKKRPNFQIDKHKLIQMTAVQHIATEIKVFRGICFLPQSPLCRSILRPSKAEFSLVTPPEKKQIFFKGSLDHYQREIILKLTHTCLVTDNFLYSLHGAAGTGKGQIIMALMLQFLYGDEFKEYGRPKIIYCARSSILIDEIVGKLKICRDRIEAPSRFSMVRVGSTKEVRREVRDFSLSILAQSLRHSNKGGRKVDTEELILEESDIICTTCSSAGMSKMISAVKKRLLNHRNQKIICILDDASQCRESDSLVPLLLGVTHLLLVGDPYQFEPSCPREKTHYLGLEMSLLWRIYKNFTNLPKDIWPISILKTQYRMNLSLSKFASKIIYDEFVQDSSGSVSKKILNLRSHLLAVDRLTDDVTGPEKENRSGQIVLQFLKAILKVTRATLKPLSILVVTCDSSQIQGLRSYIPKTEFPEVEINQTHNFQGREADIVIFYCDSSKIVLSQMATAVTRARSSLIILASQYPSISNTLFRKLYNIAEEERALVYVHPHMTSETFERVISE